MRYVRCAPEVVSDEMMAGVIWENHSNVVIPSLHDTIRL